jgi:hypothetical protein
MRVHIGKMALAVAVAAMSVAIILLLPILIPALAISEAWEARRLARTRCVNCHNPIGLEEIRRAKREGIAKAWAGVGTTSTVWRPRRIVAVWQVTCPACGQTYTYGPDRALSLVPRETGPAGLLNN